METNKLAIMLHEQAGSSVCVAYHAPVWSCPNIQLKPDHHCGYSRRSVAGSWCVWPWPHIAPGVGWRSQPCQKTSGPAPAHKLASSPACQSSLHSVHLGGENSVTQQAHKKNIHNSSNPCISVCTKSVQVWETDVPLCVWRVCLADPAPFRWDDLGSRRGWLWNSSFLYIAIFQEEL